MNIQIVGGNKRNMSTPTKEDLRKKIAELEARIDEMVYDYNKERSAVLVAEIILGVTCLVTGYLIGKLL
jgi:hypothetical protein